jgi:hypothetical protein
MTIIGTSHFTSQRAAERYYAEYGYADVKAAVQHKLAEGEIHVGPPVLKAGQTLSLIDDGARYAITEAK